MPSEKASERRFCPISLRILVGGSEHGETGPKSRETDLILGKNNILAMFRWAHGGDDTTYRLLGPQRSRWRLRSGVSGPNRLRLGLRVDTW